MRKNTAGIVIINGEPRIVDEKAYWLGTLRNIGGMMVKGAIVAMSVGAMCIGARKGRAKRTKLE